MESAFNALMGYIGSVVRWALDGFLWVIGKALFIIFDGLLTTVSAIFGAIDLSAFVSSYALNWAGLPTQMIWLINSVAIPQGVTILLAAVLIRMTLNLIPAAFTRI